MNHITQNFTKINFAVLIVLFFVTLSCSDNPSSPEKEKQVDVVTIGVEGGTIEKDNFKLTVPAGAFNGNYNISVSEVEDDGAFGGNTVSASYKIGGIPSNYSTPLKVSINYLNDSLSNNHLLAIGQNYFDTDIINYTFLESSDSTGYVVAELPVPDNEQGKNIITKISEEGVIDHFITTVKGYGTWPTEKDNFLIYYPSDWNLTKVIEFGDFLEEAYQKISDLGFKYDARTNWPVKISFVEFVDATDALTSCSWLGNNYGYISFNVNLLNDMPSAHVTAGHEFFHLVQFLYDTRYGITKSAFASRHHWVNEATGAWIEEKFSTTQNYVPSVRENFKMTPFVGMQLYPGGNTEPDVIGHGYGLSALIKYVVTNYGEGLLINIYDDLKNGKHPVDAVCQTEENKIGEFEYPVEWWEEFLKEYILGNIYSDVGLDNWTESKTTGKFEILTDTDRLKIFTNNYQDLSGKLFTVSLNYPEIDPSSQITFEVSGANKKHLSLFKYNNNKDLVNIASDYDKIIISDIKTLTEGGWNFLALVSNNRYSQPYTSQHEITLKIEVTSKKVIEAPNYTKCIVGVNVEAIWQRNIEGVISNYTETTNLGSYMLEGGFSGNTFTGSIVKYETTIQNVTITLNESNDTITNIVFTSAQDNSSTGGFVHYGFSGTNIPVTPDDEKRFEIRGIGACNEISSLYSKTDNGGTASSELQNRSCSENSLIFVSFYE